MNYIKTIYNDERPKTDYPYKLVRFLIEKYNIPKGSKVLDIGCGRGDFTEAFYAQNMLIYAIDIEDIDIRCNGFAKCDISTEYLSYKDNSFDVVFTKSVIEHLHNPDNLIKEIKRVLKPSGRAIIMTPNWHSCMYMFYDDYTHVQPYTTTGLRDLLKIYGFKDVGAEEFIQLPSVWSNRVIRLFSKCIKVLIPRPKSIVKNKFIRWSRETQILASGKK